MPSVPGGGTDYFDCRNYMQILVKMQSRSSFIGHKVSLRCVFQLQTVVENMALGLLLL